MPRLTAAPRKNTLGGLAKGCLLVDGSNAVEKARREDGPSVRGMELIIMRK